MKWVILIWLFTNVQGLNISCSTYTHCSSCTLSTLNCGWSNVTQTCDTVDDQHFNKLSASCWFCEGQRSTETNITCAWRFGDHGLISPTPLSSCRGATCAECLGSSSLCERWLEDRYDFFQTVYGPGATIGIVALVCVVWGLLAHYVRRSCKKSDLEYANL